MKMDTDFDEMFKKSLFKVPEGFFEQISEKTLAKAKLREQNHRRILIALGTFAVAASLSAVALLGYYSSNSGNPETKTFVQQKQPEVKDISQQPEINGKQIACAERKKGDTVKAIIREIKTEELSDVLPELTDDELLELSALYKTDPFIDGPQN